MHHAQHQHQITNLKETQAELSYGDFPIASFCTGAFPCTIADEQLFLCLHTQHNMLAIFTKSEYRAGNSMFMNGNTATAM